MNPYSIYYDIIEQSEEEQLTPVQLAATWFDRIKENAIREQMLADLPF